MLSKLVSRLMKKTICLLTIIFQINAEVLQVTSLESILKLKQKPKIIELYSTTCGTCKLYGPIFERVEKKLSSQIEFYKIDVDQVMTYNQYITAIPALMFISYDQLGHEQRAIIQGPPLNEESNVRMLMRYFKLNDN